jgi:hypothetical protein
MAQFFESFLKLSNYAKLAQGINSRLRREKIRRRLFKHDIDLSIDLLDAWTLLKRNPCGDRGD